MTWREQYKMKRELSKLRKQVQLQGQCDKSVRDEVMMIYKLMPGVITKSDLYLFGIIIKNVNSPKGRNGLNLNYCVIDE